MFDKETSFRFLPLEYYLWINKGFQVAQSLHKNIVIPKKNLKMESSLK